MPGQTAKEVRAENFLSAALLESQLRNIRLRGIESRLRDEIQDLKGSCLTPKHAQKASMLKSALTSVSGTRQAGDDEQARFLKEIEKGSRE